MLSTGEVFSVNLCEFPHIFFSHSSEDQLTNILNSFIKQVLKNDLPVLLSLSLGSSSAKQIDVMLPIDSLFMKFTHTDDDNAVIRNIDQFMITLITEMKKRKGLLKKRSVLPAYNAMVVFIDDIFEVLRSSNRKTTSGFIKLLLQGANYGMYFIMGSSGIYRNLLQQLINASPVSKKISGKISGMHNNIQPLGAELVVNPDGLIFFRKGGENVYVRLYPSNI